MNSWLGTGKVKTIEDHLSLVKHDVGPWWCWRLPNRPGTGGYVEVQIVGKRGRAHRYIYEHLIKKIPRGLILDHLCRNRWCCNPNHVEPVTNQVNTLRGDTLPARNVRKTHCPQGHPYDNVNTILSRGYRYCRTCLREGKRRTRRALGIKPRQFITKRIQ